jgi:lipopolysaccharide transport system ATP-binding protein
MSEVVIQVENLSKQYRIAGKQQRYKTLRDSVTEALTAPFRRAGKLLRGQATGAAGLDEKIWALKNVSFEIKQGEVIGIIGRNGAGKSTLLKILSRITEPTIGQARICGRVGALLEVGTGFHPELTGRENVYLNGAVLGMRRSEIERKFDEIVAFAEVEKFIDTPVKHFSSGMAMRLAFSVAAHLEPEILLMDEVLAVGDIAFQKKCVNKMEHVGQEGKTVLLVSHNIPAVARLCDRAILLNQGRVIRDGPSREVVATYLNDGLGTSAEREWPDSNRAPGNHIVRLRAVRVIDEDGQTTDAIDIRRPVGIFMEYEVLKSGYILWPHFTLHNEEGIWVFVAFDQDSAWKRRHRPAGRYVSIGWIPGNFLSEGMMFIGACMRTEHPKMMHFHERHAVAFQVIDSLDGDSARADHPGRFPGIVRPLLKWTTPISPDRPQYNLKVTERENVFCG